jgi:ubiquinone/menaquinone biosynthesis C-methylase UbiE
MNATHRVYSSKAEKYACYRWDYAVEAIQALKEITRVKQDTVIADIGAGTGILTRHFAGRYREVFAIEPNPEMRALAQQQLGGLPGCRVIAAAAEALPLAGHSVGLLTAGQALHWFQPEPARREFRRVLKPGGWLAFLNNRSSDRALGAALAELYTAENGAGSGQVEPPGLHTPMAYYLAEMQEFSFSFSQSQDWEIFLGGLLSASYMPAEDHPAYPNLERAARTVFERFSRGGRLETSGVTDLWVGKIAPG